MPGHNLAVSMSPDGSTHASNGGRMVTADGRTLPLKAASLTADAKAGVVRVTLQQTFVNPYAEPLTVTYQMPLPADAAVSGFSFLIGSKRIVGEVDTKQKARERFDEAVLEGRTAALLDQERSALFTQRVGNIPPRTEVVSELVIDQKLQFLADGYWEWRFPTVVAPRYLGSEGRVADASRVTVDVADAELPVRLSLALSVRDRLPDSVRPESPSHALHTVKGVQRFDVGFGSETGASLDRDVVIRWKATEAQPGIVVDTGRPIDGGASSCAYGLVTLVPPDRDARMPSVPRDLIILLDTSGSMGGNPIAQSKRVAAALIDSLEDEDTLELIEFGNSPRRWKSNAVGATPENRRDAQAWLAKLRASGGTEMRSGILEALAPLHAGAQRQVVLMTDGLIGFESEIVQAICERLPAGSRVHTVGIGSGVNRSLTSPAARAGRGVEVIIGLDEDPEAAAQRVLSRTVAPLVTKLQISGSAIDGVAPEKPCDLYGGAPSLVSVKLKAHGGEIVVRGATAGGEFLERFDVKPVERGEGSAAIAKLYAREAVEDLEVQHAAGGDRRAIDQRITTLGLDFQISTRLTSWIAVSPEATVDPRAPKRSANVPQELPYGMSAEGLGLRKSMGPVLARSVAAPAPAGAPPAAERVVLYQSALDEVSGAPEADAGEGANEEEVSGAAPPPPPRQSAGRARRSTTGSFMVSKKSAPPPARDEAKKEMAEKTRAGSASMRTLKARLVLLKDGRLAVEITVDESGLDWKPGSVTVRTKDGTTMGASVNTALTTANGRLAPGLRVTLALDIGALSAQPQSVWVINGSELLILELND